MSVNDYRHLSKMDLCGYSNVGDQNICTDWQLVSGYLKLTIIGFVQIITE